MIGISEWNYDIPVSYKLLASGNPRACSSSIWKTEEQIAIVSDYELGVRRLIDFLDQLPARIIQPLRDEALEFLSSPLNRRRFFVLECGEIFEMEGDNIVEQNGMLLQTIQKLQPQLSNSNDPAKSLGLGNWSNTLYFDLNDPS